MIRAAAGTRKRQRCELMREVQGPVLVGGEARSDYTRTSSCPAPICMVGLPVRLVKRVKRLYAATAAHAKTLVSGVVYNTPIGSGIGLGVIGE